MSNLYEISTFLIIAIVIINVIVGLTIAWELLTGSYKKYIDKRDYHHEQLRRIEQELRKTDK